MRPSRPLVVSLLAGLVVMTPTGAVAAPTPASSAPAAAPAHATAPAAPPIATLVSAPSAPAGDGELTEVDLLAPQTDEADVPTAPEPEPRISARSMPRALSESTDEDAGGDVAPDAAQGEGAATTDEPSAEAPAPQDEAPAPQDEQVIERALPTDGAAVVGLAWEPAGDARPAAQIRFGRNGTWEPWADVEMEPTADDSTGDALASEMSEGMVAAGADTVQVRIVGLDAAPLASARIVLVDGGEGPGYPRFGTSAGAPVAAPVVAGPVAQATPGEATTDVSDDVAALPGGTLDAVPAAATKAPAVVSRARWGADESIAYVGCEKPGYGDRLERFVVHHTAGSNSYSAADVPGILRGIQSYHRKGRGWCDVGYNFLVDKYGGIWEGRRGGITELVIGVHASGFNTNTVGISVLGNFVSTAPTAASIASVTSVIGWKGYLHGLNPVGTSVKNGKTYNHVIGHREVQSTSCPGLIQGHLGAISRGARSLMLGYQPEFFDVSAIPGTPGVTPAVVSAYTPVPASWSVAFQDPSGRTIATRSGVATSHGTIKASFPLAADGSVAAGTYTARLSAVSTLGKSFGASVQLTLGVAPRPPYGQIVASPDFTNTGYADLFSVDRNGRLFLHEGAGRGKIGPPRPYGTGWSPLEIHAPGDWNGDRQADLVVVDGAGLLWLYAGNGAGGFKSRVRIGHGWTGYRIVPAGDVNNDGRADLLAIDRQHRLWLYPGDGRGGFRARIQVGNSWNGYDLYAAGDMNRDGLVDILSIDGAGRLWFYAGRGGGYFYAKVQVGHGWTGYEFASGGDFDGDRVNDLMGRDPQGRLWFYKGRTNGTFHMKELVASGW